MSPEFRLTDRLREVRASTLGQELAGPLHERIEALCDLVYAAGYDRPSKKRMLAAIILAAEPNADELQAQLGRYDAARVSEALVEGQETDENVVKFPKRRQGRR